MHAHLFRLAIIPQAHIAYGNHSYLEALAILAIPVINRTGYEPEFFIEQIVLNKASVGFC